MSLEHANQLLDEVTEWTDGVLALGWVSLRQREIEEAENLTDQLREAGLLKLSETWSELTKAGRQRLSPLTNTEIDLAEPLCRFLISLEMTREAMQLASLESGENA